ncbi:MAG: DUF5658 family protein [Thermofilaceae archaeon]
MKLKLDAGKKYGLILAITALLDNVTTFYALQAGARELNIIVDFFARDMYLFIVFTIAKVFLCYYIPAVTYENTLRFKVIYFAVLALFINATVSNALNYVFSK